MKTEKTTLKTNLSKATCAALCHRSIYGQLSACHGYAAWITDKPEIYVMMAVLYAVLALYGLKFRRRSH